MLVSVHAGILNAATEIILECSELRVAQLPEYALLTGFPPVSLYH